MTVKHFTQSDTYQKSLPPTETVKISVGQIEAIGYLKSLPLNIKILYFPHSPIVTPENESDFPDWLKSAKETARKLNCAFVRFDPHFTGQTSPLKKYLQVSPRSAYRSFFIQPRFEWQTKTKPLTQLLADFNQSTRRDYNLAIRADLKVNFYTDFDENVFSIFYDLLEQTATEQNFKPQTKNYVRELVKTALAENAGFLTIVKQTEKPLAATLTLTLPHHAFYVFGGLNYQSNVPGTAVFMHSQIINYLHGLGFETYNFGAINHQDWYPKYKGVTTFKQRFPGEVIDYGPLYDLLIKPVWYYVYTIIRWWRDFLNQLKS